MKFDQTGDEGQVKVLFFILCSLPLIELSMTHDEKGDGNNWTRSRCLMFLFTSGFRWHLLFSLFVHIDRSAFVHPLLVLLVEDSQRELLNLLLYDVIDQADPQALGVS